MIYFSNHHLTVTLVDDLHTCIIYTSKEPLDFGSSSQKGLNLRRSSDGGCADDGSYRCSVKGRV